VGRPLKRVGLRSSTPAIETKTAIPVYLFIIINLSGNWQGVLFKKQHQASHKIPQVQLLFVLLKDLPSFFI
jgi:hypothetical protein